MRKKIGPQEIARFIEAAGSDDLGTFGGKYEGGIHCQQIPDELAPCLLAIMESGKKISSYLEIGAAAGGTTYLIDHFLSPERMSLIDDNKHAKAGMRKSVLEKVKATVTEFIGESQSEEISSGIIRHAGGFDFILIDGDHNYPGVKLDVVLYLPFLKPGGFLALHDSALTKWGVPRVVRELKRDPGMEFVGEYVSTVHPAPCGLALFRKRE